MGRKAGITLYGGATRVEGGTLALTHEAGYPGELDPNCCHGLQTLVTTETASATSAVR